MVEAFRSGPVSGRFDFSGLDWMQKSKRNGIVREALRDGGTAWRAAFAPKRFDAQYVKRAPFSWKMTKGAFWTRQIHLGRLVIMANKYFGGFNPYASKSLGQSSTSPLSTARFQKWLEEQKRKGRYRFSITGNYSGAVEEWRRLVKAEMRAAVKEAFDDGQPHSPLIMTGELIKSVMTGKITPRATASIASCAVSLPRAGRQNRVAVKLLGTVPGWEMAFFRREVHKSVQQRISAALAKRDAELFEVATRRQAKIREGEAKRFLAAEARKEKTKQRSSGRAPQRTAA